VAAGRGLVPWRRPGEGNPPGAQVGERFFERFIDGDEMEVGRFTLCDPPHRIVPMAGSRLAGQTEVDVTFAAEADRAGVSLTHRGFDRFSALS
jgi:hypothetical protein